VPLAAHAIFENQQMQIRSFVASVDGQTICRASANAQVQTVAEAEALGLAVAQDLISQGAAALLPK